MCDLSKVRIGMSVLNIRSNTIKNLKYLQNFARLNQGIEVEIFNKTGESLGDLQNTENFNLYATQFEDLYQTMSRLDLESVSHVLWLNDDDSFLLPDSAGLSKLACDSVAYPDMSILTSERLIKIDWQPIFLSTSMKNAFRNYWKIASPLFFCIIPVDLFKVWINYVNEMDLHLPHLDTQLNVLVAIQDKRQMIDNFSYTYGAENWETSEKLIESSLRFSRAFKKSDDFLYCMEIIRNIDNVCILSAYASEFKTAIPRNFLREVLLQFSPLQNGRSSRIFFKIIIRNWLPVSLRRRLILFRMKDRKRKSFFLGIPKDSIDFFLGSKILRTPKDLLAELSKENMAALLMVPESMMICWQTHLLRLIEESH